MDNPEEPKEEIPEQIRKYIITDPGYIMTDLEWDKLILQKINLSNRKTELTFPFNCQYKKNGTLITIYEIQRTANGDGSHTFRNQEIGVDSGMLCIAENRKGWDEQYGALLETLTEARVVFPHIIKYL